MLRVVSFTVVGCGVVSQLVACSASEDDKVTSEDDPPIVDAPAGDDDDNHGIRHSEPPLPAVPTQMTMWAQFTVLDGGVVPEITDGAEVYRTILVLNLGPDDWDPSNVDDPRSCQVTAELTTGTGTVFDAVGRHSPYLEVSPSAVPTSTCDGVLDTNGVDPTTLVSAVPGWAVGVPLALSPTAQADLDALISPGDANLLLGALFNVPLLSVPLVDSFYGLGVAVDSGAGITEDPILASELTETELPNGVYYLDPFRVFDITGLLGP